MLRLAILFCSIIFVSADIKVHFKDNSSSEVTTTEYFSEDNYLVQTDITSTTEQPQTEIMSEDIQIEFPDLKEDQSSAFFNGIDDNLLILILIAIIVVLSFIVFALAGSFCYVCNRLRQRSPQMEYSEMEELNPILRAHNNLNANNEAQQND